MRNASFFTAPIVVISLFTALAESQAQNTTPCDTIYTNSGQVIIANIQRTTRDEVSFFVCGDKAEKLLVLKNSDLLQIKYHDKKGIEKPEGSQKIETPAVDPNQTWRIETTDDNDYIGKILEEDKEKVRLKTETLGEITIRKAIIKSISKVTSDQMVDGEYWFRNPHDTRYYFGPNGYGLRQGEGYYQNAWVFYNQASYGITNNISVGAGVVPLFLFGGLPSPVWITPKVSVPVVKNKFNVGAGAFMGTVLGEEGTGFGIVYGVATVGSRNQNATLGVGYGYADGNWATQPALSLSLMMRAGKKIALISENYSIKTFDERVSLVSFGARFLGKKVAIDAALVAPIVGTDQDFFFAFPWLGINVPFGKQEPGYKSGKK